MDFKHTKHVQFAKPQVSLRKLLCEKQSNSSQALTMAEQNASKRAVAAQSNPFYEVNIVKNVISYMVQVISASWPL
jgi:hypothetical protein